MSKYRFVPDNVANLVDGVCAANDLTCLDLRKEGSYSVYVATVTDGNTTIEKKMGYDYALHLLPEARPAFLASELLAAFGLQPDDVKAVAEVPAVDEVDSEPPALVPAKPAKRGKTK